jgi:hypothetical protein
MWQRKKRLHPPILGLTTGTPRPWARERGRGAGQQGNSEGNCPAVSGQAGMELELMRMPTASSTPLSLKLTLGPV